MTLPLFPGRPAPAAPRPVTLVRLAGEIARLLVPVGRIAVEGEVYRPNRTGGGRVYFTLRDRAAQIAVMCPQARATRCRTVAGERVCVVGALTWVSERGDLILVAEEVTPVGAGAVAAMIAEARQRLAADGLLDRRRRALPRLPRAIGVICAADAAVRKDIESVVASRFAGYPLRIADCFLSGPGASVAITDALRGLQRERDVEVIILARGGGDATQLLPWSDEELCRAICACRVPVVSAIGHETDRPLCDEVADLRCATPLAAAAAVVPDREALEAGLQALRSRALTALERRLERAGQRLGRVDTGGAVRQAVALGQARLHADRRHLDALSPQRVLERGYAVVRAAGGTVVRRPGQVSAGDVLVIQVAEGSLRARVDEVDQMDKTDQAVDTGSGS